MYIQDNEIEVNDTPEEAINRLEHEILLMADNEYRKQAELDFRALKYYYETHGDNFEFWVSYNRLKRFTGVS